MTPEQWEEWRAHPATEWFFEKFLRNEVRRTKHVAMTAAWANPMSEREHAAYRERADAFAWLRNLTHGDIEAAMAAQQSENDEWLKAFPGK